MTKNKDEAYLYLTWSTKCREDFFEDKNHLDQVLIHISENAVKKGITIHAIGGFSDHIHVLVSLSTNTTIGRTLMLIKGESTWWIRRNIKELRHFEWQNGYNVRAVPPDSFTIVRDYILNQEKHPLTKTSDDDVKEEKKSNSIAAQDTTDLLTEMNESWPSEEPDYMGSFEEPDKPSTVSRSGTGIQSS